MMKDSSRPVTRSKLDSGSNKACGACGEVCECIFGLMKGDRGRTRQLSSPEASPGKKQRKGVKVIPNRKRCKAIESVPEDLDGPSVETNKPLVVDLRSEARIAAEENSRLSKGKQIHPFFASRTSAKKIVETSENVKIDDKNPHLIQKKDLSFCPPIHVHDTDKSEVKLDWGNWTFKERSAFEKNTLSILEASSLVFANMVKIKPLTLETNGVIIPTKEIFSDLDSVCDSSKICLPNENEDIICNKSYQADSSLWTDKYQPENASQVCGNSESVNFLSEWLKCWHERGRKSNKKSQFLRDISIEESENSWYNASDLEELREEEEINFQNVLLITGPVGSGKSAAVYACAKEQGFNIVEVSASDLRNGMHIKQKFGEATESHGLGKWSREEIMGSNGDNLPSTSGGIDNNETINNRVILNKTLVLFEDVDTVFEEDRGFIATLLQLADSTKWPIILTSNNKNPILPRALNHLILEFNRPSSEELLSHLNKICTLEKTGIPIPLIKHAINSCLGDIRKTIILLQFWCQGKREYISTKEDIIPFDIDAVHSILPKALNFGFQCELSEKIHSEINQTITSIENRSLQIELQNLVNLSPIKSTPSKPNKKKSKLKKNQIISESSEPVPNPSDLNDFNSTPNTPVPVVKQKSRNKRALVLSDSDEEICTEPQLIQNNPLMDCMPLQLGLLNDNAIDPFGFNCASYSSPSRVCDTFISVVPESLCDTVSMNWNSNEGIIEKNIVLMNENFNGDIIERNNASVEASVSNNCELRNVVIDECSSAGWNFNNNNNNNSNNNNTNYNFNNDISFNDIGSVKETWEILKDKCNDLKNCVKNDCREGSEILKVASRVSDLISETDILFSDCNPLIFDKMDESLSPSKEQDDVSCNDTLVEIGSVYAHHGLGLYLRSNSSFETTTDMANEILVSSRNSAAIGRLLTSGGINNEVLNEAGSSFNHSSSFFSEKRQKESSLYDAIFSLVPPKLAISLRGPSFHEYISSISQISKLEFFRLSQTEMGFFNRRSRARHYLTSGSLQLSPEEAQLFRSI